MEEFTLLRNSIFQFFRGKNLQTATPSLAGGVSNILCLIFINFKISQVTPSTSHGKKSV